ncbi:hypothetical protein Mal48_28210 [Thalassoglobus polymorphus]|uniref:Uncharacterized protein n=1 Tax=Thalassoglobus polymorphus TaxID=2527994 RepID=A0A517QPJ4_9PLAN|nr:hypothetical protein Mal48_28210 [Thalassoglobus polymorphus]
MPLKFEPEIPRNGQQQTAGRKRLIFETKIASTGVGRRQRGTPKILCQLREAKRQTQLGREWKKAVRPDQNIERKEESKRKKNDHSKSGRFIDFIKLHKRN